MDLLILPNELLYHIFPYINQNDIVNVMSVCKLFKTILQDPKVLHLIASKEYISGIIIKTILNNIDNKYNLSLSINPNLSSKKLVAIKKKPNDKIIALLEYYNLVIFKHNLVFTQRGIYADKGFVSYTQICLINDFNVESHKVYIGNNLWIYILSSTMKCIIDILNSLKQLLTPILITKDLLSPRDIIMYNISNLCYKEHIYGLHLYPNIPLIKLNN